MRCQYTKAAVSFKQCNMTVKSVLNFISYFSDFKSDISNLKCVGLASDYVLEFESHQFPEI